MSHITVSFDNHFYVPNVHHVMPIVDSIKVSPVKVTKGAVDGKWLGKIQTGNITMVTIYSSLAEAMGLK